MSRNARSCSRFPVLLLLLIALLPTTLRAAATDEVPTGKLPENVVPLHYRLAIDADPAATRFSGTAEIDVRIQRRTRRIYLHGLDLEVTRAIARRRDGQTVEASYRQLDPTGVVALDFKRPLGAGEFTLAIDYAAVYPTEPNGLHRLQADGKAFLFTQHQPIDARRTFPGFDEPRFKTPYDLSVTAPKGNVVIANAPLARTESLGEEQQRWVFQTSARLPTYLTFLAVGPFAVVEAPPLPPNAVRSQPIPLRGIARPGKERELEAMLAATPAMIAELESYFDLPYPYAKLDLVASPDFPGAMENPGAILYGETSLLVNGHTSIGELRGIAETHAHELAHQWFGNYVTPLWWDSIWLNESFASWMGKRTAERWRPDLEIAGELTVDALSAMGIDARTSSRAIANPVPHNSDISSTFDSITYLKGGGVLAMFERYLGEDGFRDGVRLHIRRFADGNADTADFMQSLAEGSRRAEVVTAFESFIVQSGLPLIETSIDCSGDAPRVRLHQSRYLPLGSQGTDDRSWRIPACVLIGGAGLPEQRCVLVDGERAEITLEQGAACPAWVLPNAGGAGYYRFALDGKGWDTLLEALPQLDDGSALVGANNFVAAFSAGKLDAPTLQGGLEHIAQLPSSDAAVSGSLFWSLDQQLLGPSARPAYREWLAAQYRERFDAIGYHSDTALDREDPTETALWRSKLAEVLGSTARDPQVSTELARRAERFLDGGKPGVLHHDALDAGIAGSALVAGVRVRGKPFFDALLEDMLASSDTAFQFRAATALGSTEDPVLAARVRTLLLDPRLSSLQVMGMAGAQSRVTGEQDRLLDWIDRNMDAFGERLSPIYRADLPWYAASYCSAEGAGRVKAVFGPRATALGADIALAQVLEGIELCAARKAKYGSALDALFGGDAGR